MPLDSDRIAANARDGVAFSNSTEWECWSANWCDSCLRDAPFRNMGTGSGCPLILLAMCGEQIPAEWVAQPWGEKGPPLGERYHCTEFVPIGTTGTHTGPRRHREPPGMDGLFPRPDRVTHS